MTSKLKDDAAAARLVEKKGGKPSDLAESLRLAGEGQAIARPLYGPPIRIGRLMLYPAGRWIVASDEATMTIENVAGRRVRRLEIQRDGQRLNVVDDPANGLSLTVTAWGAGQRSSQVFDSWDALSRGAPEVFRAYESYRSKFDAESLQGRELYVGGYGRIGHHPPSPLLGVHGEPHAGGLRLTEVSGPAEQAGLRKGDILTHLDGVPIHDFGALVNLVGRREVGQKLKIRFERDKQPQEQQVTLGTRPDTSPIGLDDGGMFEGSISYR